MEQVDIAMIAVIVLSTIALIGVLYKMKSGFGPFNLKVFGLTFVVGLAAILCFSEIEKEILLPCFGLLGTVVGYLLGITQNK